MLGQQCTGEGSGGGCSPWALGRFGGEARQEGALGLEGVGPRDEERGEAGSSLGRLDRPREGMRSTRSMQRKQGAVLCSTGSRSRAAASGSSGAGAKDGGRGTGREGGTDLTGGEVLRAWGGGKPAATDLEIPGGAPVFPAKERKQGDEREREKAKEGRRDKGAG